MADGKPISSICWDCARACGLSEVRCSWFGKEKTLPTGCEYEEKKIWPGTASKKADPEAYTIVYIVKECPQFLEETAEVKAELARIRAKKAEVKVIDKSGLCRLNLGRK